MIKSSILFISLFIITSCATKTNSQNKLAFSSKKRGAFDVYLEDLIKNQSTGRSYMNQPSKPGLSLDSLLNSKKTFSATEKTTITKAQHKLFLKAAQKGDVDQLAGLNFNQVIRIFEQVGESRVQSLSASLAEKNGCNASADIYFSAATLTEKYFPEESAYSRAVFLHRQAVKCEPSEEVSLRSNYRLAMLNLLKSDCKNAQNHLNIVKNFSKTPLKARANYWFNNCESQDNEYLKRLPATETKNTISSEDNLLSFHALLELKNKNLKPRDIVFTKTLTPVQFRSKTAKALNSYVEGFEYFWPENKQAAEIYINKIKTAEFANAEPEFLIYIGYLASLVDANITSFQAFSRAISKNAELKSLSTVELFYPRKYRDEIYKFSQEQNVDPLLVMALIRQESAFNVRATSRVGARGLMQIMPKTARTLDRKMKKSDLYVPEKNIELGTRYFSNLLKRYDNNVVHALAAYNAGFGNVDRWIQRYKTTNDLLFMDMIPFQETRDYVSSILRNYYWYSSLENANTDSPIKIGWNE
jgi:soluble lytic murein transglycosylase